MWLTKNKKQGQEETHSATNDKILLFLLLVVLSCMTLFLNLDYEVRQQSLRRVRDLGRLTVSDSKSFSWHDWPVNDTAVGEIRQRTKMIDHTRLHHREIRGTIREEPYICGRRNKEKCLLRGHNHINHYNTCAIIGGGGILTGSLCGDEIDAHQFVLRINLAPIEGYQEDVGTKTSLTFLNQAMMFNVNIEPDLNPFAETLRLSNHTMFLAPKGKFTRVFQKFYNASRTNRVIISLKYFPQSTNEHGLLSMLEKVAKHMNSKLRGQPTTGMLAILMATHFCRRINLYGFWPFDRDSDNRSVPYHYYTIPYYEPRLPREIAHQKGEQHDFDKEFAFYQALQNRGALRIVDRACKKGGKPGNAKSKDPPGIITKRLANMFLDMLKNERI